MFEGSLVESTPLLQNRNRWPAVVSVASQAAIAAVLIAVPMFHPELLPMHAPSMTLVAPPPPIPPQAPPPPMQHLRAVVAETNTPAAPAAPALQQEHHFLHILTSTVSVGPDTALAANVGPGMVSTAAPSLGITDGPASGTSPVVRVAPAPHVGPVTISRGVTAGLLIAPIRPDYPTMARVSRQEGTVVIEAIISRTGSIESAHVLSGNPMLQQAALEAVEKARYRPYLLNGEPTEVQTTININFHLGS